MLATKYAIDTHFIIKKYKNPYKLLLYIYDSFKRTPYTINYEANKTELNISYEGPEFGLKELAEIAEKQKDRKIGGNGAKNILNNSNISYNYDGIKNIWTIKGDFIPFIYERKIPENIDDLTLNEFYEYNNLKDPVYEISYNIIGNHNIKYNKNVTLFIIRIILFKYWPNKIKDKIIKCKIIFKYKWNQKYNREA